MGIPSFGNGLTSGLTAGGYGAITGGVTGGIRAAELDEDNIWSGKIVDETVFSTPESPVSGQAMSDAKIHKFADEKFDWKLGKWKVTKLTCNQTPKLCY